MSPDSRERYSRQVLLPEVGFEGQKRLANARVLIVGVGGLGSPLALYLAAAGVGTIGLVEQDRVDLSNLQRQILYRSVDEGQSKVRLARERLLELNPNIEVVAYDAKLAAVNAFALIDGYDLVIDGTDNFNARYLLNDACVLRRKPLIYASVLKFEGHVSMVLPREGPCYRCLHPTPPPPELAPSCVEAGVLGVVPGTLAMLQATEAQKYLLGIVDSLAGRVLYFDAHRMKFREIRLTRDEACAVCGDFPSIHELKPVLEEGVCPATREISANDLSKKLGSILLIDVRSLEEHQAERIRGSTLVPLARLPDEASSLDPESEIVVYCRSGQRSARAAALLADRGFARVLSLRGGIEAYKSLYSTEQDG